MQANDEQRDAALAVRQRIVGLNLADPDEIDRAIEVWRSGAEADDLPVLGEVLIDRGVLTAWQWRQVCNGRRKAARSGQLPGYELIQRIGVGARGVVFKARQIKLDRIVAVKILHAQLCRSARFAERLMAEAHAAARLSHPNIVSAVDVGSHAGQHFFVMEWVDGQTVHEHIASERRYEEKQALAVIIQIAKALAHAHEREMIHCDVKPRNIIVTRAGVAKLADFGLTRSFDQPQQSEEVGKSFGTPFYNSPEQILGKPVDPRTDIYSLGATFYHMVTGQPPFTGQTTREVWQKHLRQPVTPPDHINTKLSMGVGQLIETMMAKDPDQRYESTATLLEDLDLIARDRPPMHAIHTFSLGAMTALEAAAQSDPGEHKNKRQAAPEARRAGEKRMLIGSLVVNGLLIIALAVVITLLLMGA